MKIVPSNVQHNMKRQTKEWARTLTSLKQKKMQRLQARTKG
jgi:hypothetical protein